MPSSKLGTQIPSRWFVSWWSWVSWSWFTSLQRFPKWCLYRVEVCKVLTNISKPRWEKFAKLLCWNLVSEIAPSSWVSLLNCLQQSNFPASNATGFSSSNRGWSDLWVETTHECVWFPKTHVDWPYYQFHRFPARTVATGVQMMAVKGMAWWHGEVAAAREWQKGLRCSLRSLPMSMPRIGMAWHQWFSDLFGQLRWCSFGEATGGEACQYQWHLASLHCLAACSQRDSTKCQRNIGATKIETLEQKLQQPSSDNLWHTVCQFARQKKGRIEADINGTNRHRWRTINGEPPSFQNVVKLKEGLRLWRDWFYRAMKRVGSAPKFLVAAKPVCSSHQSNRSSLAGKAGWSLRPLAPKTHPGSALARMEVVKKVSIEFVKIIAYDVVMVIHSAWSIEHEYVE